jgi:hypothetical protein
MSGGPSISSRVLAGAKEPFRHLGPLQGLFKGESKESPRSFDESFDGFFGAVEDRILTLSDANGGATRHKSVLDQLKVAYMLAKEAGRDIKQFDYPETPLSEDQIAAIHLYSQETDTERNADSAYSLLNAALRSEDRNKVKAVKNLIWLIMSALDACPESESKVLHRGVRADLSAQYQDNRIVTWFQFSSCTSTLEALENPMFLGTSGDRTILTVELLGKDTRARCIELYSSMREKEVILPPNTRVQVCARGKGSCMEALLRFVLSGRGQAVGRG